MFFCLTGLLKAHIFSTLFHTRGHFDIIASSSSPSLSHSASHLNDEKKKKKKTLLLLYCDTVKKVESKIRRNIEEKAFFSRDFVLPRGRRFSSSRFCFPRQTRECAPNGRRRRRRRRRLAVFYFFERALFEARLRSASIRSSRNRRKYDARARSIPTDRISLFFLSLRSVIWK